jgi:hypothetical protein
MGTKITFDSFLSSWVCNEVVMTDFRSQVDSESAETKRRGFGWLTGAVVLAMVLGLILGIDHERTLVFSNDIATSPMIAPASPQSSPTTFPRLTPPRPVTPDRL